MRSIAERNDLVEKNIGLVSYCVKKMNFGKYDEDLFQIGCFGLMRAAELYDETLGFKFSTFAAKVIEKSLLNEVFTKRRKIRDNEISGDMPILDGNITVFDTIGDDGDFAEDLTEEMTRDQMIERVVSVLPQREKQIFELMKNGKNQREIAEIVNISQPHIGKVIKRIIKAFKDETILKKYALKKAAEDKRKINAERVRERRISADDEIKNRLESDNMSGYGGFTPVIDYDEIKRLHEQGFHDKDIAEKVSCCRRTIQQWRKKNDLPINSGNNREVSETPKPEKASVPPEHKAMTTVEHKPVYIEAFSSIIVSAFSQINAIIDTVREDNPPEVTDNYKALIKTIFSRALDEDFDGFIKCKNKNR